MLTRIGASDISSPGTIGTATVTIITATIGDAPRAVPARRQFQVVARAVFR
jgi:hypothetical protein